jgi:hypothetical protein
MKRKWFLCIVPIKKMFFKTFYIMVSIFRYRYMGLKPIGFNYLYMEY